MTSVANLTGDQVSYHSTFLFAQPSFTSGLARLVDFGAAFDSYNESETPELADYLAALNDWFAVGEEIGTAMSRFGHDR